MEWKSVRELRELFIDFFKSKGHMHIDSFSLVPEDDGSLLFINSGMAPMKKWFLGLKKPPCERIVTVQKCIRTGDLEMVGKTARHGTFFEMLGNFSFGNYFKKEAIFFAWEFITDVLKMPKEKLYVTVYEDDDESYYIWKDEVGVLKSKIFRLGKKDNFWEIGLGPCGPCSEIYFDRGEKYGCGEKDCSPGCECDRFFEFWNLVFSQYDNKGNGKYKEMAKKNIDTGMGLERLALIFQRVDSIFEVDTIKKILNAVSDLVGYNYGENEEKDEYIRVITDHIRSIVFLIGDGVNPSNEGKGYVLRRLIRRAKKSGKKLGFYRQFLKELVGVVVEQNLTFYPNLKINMEYIGKVIESEEKSFEKILQTTEEKAGFLFNELKKEKLKKLYNLLKEFVLKENANFLAFEEEINSFFGRFKTEFERFFNIFSGETIYDGYNNFLEEKQKILKREAYDYFYRLEKIFSILNEPGNEKNKENHIESPIWKNFKENMDHFFEIRDINNTDENYIRNNKIKLKKIVEFFDEQIKTAIKKFREIFVDFCFNKERFESFFEKKDEDFFEKENKLKEYIIKLFNLAEYLGYKEQLALEDFFKKGAVFLAGKDAFKLCDTYGLPFDILKDMAKEEDIDLDEEGFFELLEQQKQRSKKNAQFKDVGWNEEKQTQIKNLPKTEFVGYEKLKCEAKILYIKNKKDFEFDVIFNRTPFYAVGGGQKADFGEIIDPNTNFVLGYVEDVIKTDSLQYIHTVKFFETIPLVDDVVFLQVDYKKRKATEKNHTAAHILHSVLKNIFGDHINQAGQYVDDNRLRFDFNSFDALKKDDIKKVQDSVNEIILKGLDVNIYNMDVEEAKRKGAIALFGEKYGDIVRVVDILNFSTELCSGTHVKNTKEIGAFKILNESSVGAGIRRIEGITGTCLVSYSSGLEEILETLCKTFKTNDIESLQNMACNLLKNYKKTANELEDIKLKICEKEFDDIVKNCKKTDSFLKVIFKEEILDKKQLNLFADRIKKKYDDLVSLIFSKNGEKRNIVVLCGKKAIEDKADAAAIVKRLALVAKTKGGGRKDFAVAGILKNFDETVLEKEFFKIIKETAI